MTKFMKMSLREKKKSLPFIVHSMRIIESVKDNL